jgi:hypothetical protein
MNTDYPVPLILTCKVTGCKVKYYSRPYIEKRIAKAGDLTTLINTFVMKGAKKQKKPTGQEAKTWNGKIILNGEQTSKAPINNNVGERVYNFNNQQVRVTYS